MVVESRTAVYHCSLLKQHLGPSSRKLPSLDRIISSNIKAVGFSVFTDETSGFSIRIFLFAVFNQSAVGGLVVSQFLCRIGAAHGFGTECLEAVQLIGAPVKTRFH